LIGCLSAPLIASGIKRVVNDTKWGARPNGGQHSFPSGHTTSAFAGAMVYLIVFGLLWAIIPLLLAAVTGYSRVVSKNHWPRDVVAGAALGMVTVAFAFWIT
jgi:membrane-associated phospholipid phosphatase